MAKRGRPSLGGTRAEWWLDYYAANKERIAEYQRAYRLKHKEKAQKYQAGYYKKNAPFRCALSVVRNPLLTGFGRS